MKFRKMHAWASTVLCGVASLDFHFRRRRRTQSAGQTTNPSAALGIRALEHDIFYRSRKLRRP